MKRIIIGILILSLAIWPLVGCGSNGIANNPIEVVDKVKVGMTESQVKEVVDLKYFQDNNSYLMIQISEVVSTGKGFNYTVSDNPDAPYYGELYYSVESDIDVALLIFKWSDSSLVAVGVVPFTRAKEIAESHYSPLWHLRD